MKHSAKTLLLTFGVLLVFLLQLFTGSVFIPFGEVVNALRSADMSHAHHIIIHASRVPAAITSLVAGAALALSGLLMQTLFRNPLAGPYVMGISSGAGLGVALLMMGSTATGVAGWWFLETDISLVAAALAGSLVTFSFINFIWLRLNNSAAMLIIGLMLTGAIQSVIEILQSFSTSEAIRNYVYWTFGSFRNATLQQSLMMAAVVLPVCALSLRMSRSLNLALMGDDYAQSSGLNLQRFKMTVSLLACALAAVTTAYCGPVALVGLAAPHAGRLMLRTASHQKLLVPVMLLGALLCGGCNLLTQQPGINLPLNAVAALTGTPFIVWLIMKKKNIWI